MYEISRNVLTLVRLIQYATHHNLYLRTIILQAHIAFTPVHAFKRISAVVY